MTQEPQAAVLPSSHVQQQPFGPQDPSALLWALLISSSSPSVCALTHTRTHAHTHTQCNFPLLPCAPQNSLGSSFLLRDIVLGPISAYRGLNLSQDRFLILMSCAKQN